MTFLALGLLHIKPRMAGVYGIYRTGSRLSLEGVLCHDVSGGGHSPGKHTAMLGQIDMTKGRF